jgi:hypothetical protein
VPAGSRLAQFLGAAELRSATPELKDSLCAAARLLDTRDGAAEHAVRTWATLTEGRDVRQVALVADAANTEIDRLNALWGAKTRSCTG